MDDGGTENGMSSLSWISVGLTLEQKVDKKPRLSFTLDRMMNKKSRLGFTLERRASENLTADIKFQRTGY